MCDVGKLQFFSNPVKNIFWLINATICINIFPDKLSQQKTRQWQTLVFFGIHAEVKH